MKKYTLKPFSSDAPPVYTGNLNEPQREVVRNAEGPSLVLAGAGSGKTRVLVYRLAHLLERGENIRTILLVTFTNKAAHEMTNRAEALLGRTLTGLWAGTFHHIGNVILRRESRFLDYSSTFSIIDAADSKDMIDDCIEELGYKKGASLFPKKEIIARIQSLSRNSMKEIDLIVGEQYEHLEEYLPHIKKVLERYAKKKRDAQVMDFDDLLGNWLALLENEPLRVKYAKLFKYILVDEYQDTNRVQFEILKRLSSVHRNILAVGDDAQSIYSFRAANIHNLLDFPATFEGTTIFRLQINYRSTPEILHMANSIIAHNTNQFPKELTAIKKDGTLPVIARTKDVYQQAHFVAQRIMELNQEGIPLDEMAVLFRSRFHSLELEMELLKRNIPYLVRGGVRFFEQSHIKDVLAYLKILINPQDELSFKRALSLHSGIGRGYAHRIWEKITQEKKGYKAVEESLPKRQRAGFKTFSRLLEQIKDIASPEETIKAIIDSYKEYCHVSFDNPHDRISDLEELAKMARVFPTVKRFLLDLNSYEDFKGETLLGSHEKEQVLVLSTIHQAKGLEWEAVFLIGFSEYDFPHPKALGSKESIEEERRLFYVAVTRTKSILYISYSQSKYTFRNGLILSRPSPFLEEIPASCYEEWGFSEPRTLISPFDDTDPLTDYIK